MKKLFTAAIAIIFTAYIAAAGYLYVQQRAYLYNPIAIEKAVAEPEVSIINNGVGIKGWVLNPKKPSAILYFPGKSDEVSTYIPTFTEIFPNHAVYLFNYRGYGNSEGEPTEEAIYSDALKIYDTAAKKHNQISVIGRSLGTGVATYVASERKIEKLVLTTPFDSITNIAKHRYPIFPVDWMLEDTFDSASRVTKIKVPTLVFKSETDESVPHQYTDNLLQVMNNPIVKTISGTDHFSIIDDKNYQQQLGKWFQ